ncbi:30S ribosomal protein S17e [Candidatus Woesearchaeota archaeon]|nr:30S ribosomal protein S17e [Candidatus Woesearchaeota archaeon]
MGRIKTVPIKRATMEVLENNSDMFTADFEKNKEVVNSLLDIKSKKIRNMIAGYVTRLKKKQAA